MTQQQQPVPQVGDRLFQWIANPNATVYEGKRTSEGFFFDKVNPMSVENQSIKSIHNPTLNHLVFPDGDVAVYEVTTDSDRLILIELVS